jgi:hypothetical protein
MQLAKAERLL